MRSLPIFTCNRLKQVDVILCASHFPDETMSYSLGQKLSEGKGH